MLFKNINFLNEKGSVTKNHHILVENDTISYIGSDCPKNYAGAVFDGHDMLLMPGFVNTHCHVPMTLLRSLGANHSLSDWLTTTIFPYEAKLTPEAVYNGALLGIGEMIKSGVTSFNDMYYYSERICDAVVESGIKANISMEGLSFDDSLKSKFAQTKEKIIDFHNHYNGMANGRIKIDVSIHSEYTGNTKKAEEIGNLARDLNTCLQIHLSETENETKQCIVRYGKTPTKYFNDLGVFDNHVTAAHCIYLNDDDINILKNKNVAIAHCPVSNLKLGSGICDIIRLKNSGLNITIGTDGAASNDNLNFIEDIKTAILLQKGIHKNASLLTSSDILKMATTNGAVSQRRFNTGEIAVGKKADLFVVDFNNLNLLPNNDFLDGMVYSATAENIVLTMVDGKIVYKNGVFTGIDIEKLKHNIKNISSLLTQ